MGLSLRKIKDAVIAQVNPFDHGQTANTVFNGRPAQQTIRPTGLASRNGTIYIDQQARQASQARPQTNFSGGAQQQQQKPSFISAVMNEYRNPSNAVNNVLKTGVELVGSPIAPVAKTLISPNVDLTKAAIGQFTGNQKARNNALEATKQDYIGKGSAVDTGREWVSRPLGTLGMTAKEAVTGQTQSYDPNSAVDKAIFGDRPIQGVGAGVQDTYRNHPNDPEWKRLALAGGYGAFQTLNAVPVATGAIKGGLKVTGKALDKAPVALNAAKDIKAQVPITSMNQGGSINPAQAFKDLRDKLNNSALDTTVKPATPENVYGVNALEKLGKKLKMNQGGGIPNPAYDPLDALKAEAKKYKSAEEFAMAKLGEKYGFRDRADLNQRLTAEQAKYDALHSKLKRTKNQDTKNAIRKEIDDLLEFQHRDLPRDERGNVKTFTRQELELTDLYNQAHTQPTPKVESPRGAPIEKTPTVKIAESAPKPVVKAAPPTEPNVVKPVDVDAQLEKEIFGTMADPNYKQSTLGKLGETLSPNRQIRKVTQAIEGGINKGLRGSLESGSRIVRTPGRTVAGVSRQAGRTNEELAQYGKLQGGKQMGDELGLKIAQTGDEAIKQGINPTKIADALDPALTSARGGKAPVLTELEQSEVNRLRRIIDLTHEGEHNLGLLNDKVYEANKGTYFPRNFDEFFENDVTRQIAKDNKLDLNIFKNRKDLADIPKEVLEKANRDPYYMTALRTQQYAKNKAVVEHTRWLKDSGSVIDTPKKGYIQVPDSPAYGAIKGKYVLKEQLEDLQGFIYETDSAQHVVALLNTFDRNPARQFLKKTKTVYNPGVRLGNRTFNYLTAGINGINPITYTKNWARANGMMKNKSPEFIEATKEGVFGSSIIDKELYQVGDALTPTKGNVVTKAVRGTDNAITNTYKGVDDKAKMATYLTFRERGVAPAEAAKRTRRAMQNYDMVGQFFDLGAKAPIGGSAFVRFSSELIRMAHNSAVDNPLRLAGAMASVVALTTMASKMSGESPEDRKTREGRLGAPKVPFTNQSLEVQTPYGAINIGRLLGVTTYNDINGGVAEDGKRLLPFQLPITNTKNGVKFNPSFVTSDPLIGPIIGQIIDKDFRGKSIKDPENTGQFLDKLSTKDQVINRAKVAGMSYLPLANEANSLLSAVQGKENFYGKKRSPAQAGLRVAGVKVEQYGPEQANKQRGIDEYFKEKDALDKEVATLPKKDQEAYRQATGYYRLREQVPNEFSPGETRYKKAPVYDFSENKWGEYASSPKLYDLIMKDKERKAQKGQPLQPEFDKTLSSEFRKQLISNKALAPGEDVEADQRMYQSSEWDTYSKLKDKYTQDAKKYYPSKGDDTFADEMVKHQNAPFPKKGSAKQAYDDAYGLYAKGQGPKPTYTDQVDADKEAYSDAKLKWTNTERKARGLGPISKETWDNVTFGFQSDEEKVYKELKYGNGYGSYSKYSSRGGSSRGGGSGGGGSSSKTGLNSDAPNLYKYAISTTAKTAKPTVKKAGAVAKVGVAMKTKTAKPKVTIKKSKV